MEGGVVVLSVAGERRGEFYVSMVNAKTKVRAAGRMGACSKASGCMCYLGDAKTR